MQPTSPLNSPSAVGSSSRHAACSLAVFDPTLSGDDERRAMDNIIYFYPESTPDNLKMNHVGLCSAVSGLCETFAEAPLDTIRTDMGLTALLCPLADRQLWIAATLPPIGLALSHNPVATEILVDETSALMRSVLREAFDAFSFRFGSDALTSPPTVSDFFDRFCERAMLFDPTALFRAKSTGSVLQWMLGLATCHSTLSAAEYHLVRSVVAHVAPTCTSYVLISDNAVVVSTAGREVTHAALLLLQLFGSELPSFAAYTNDVPGPQWCHVVHCAGQHAFLALCHSSMEEAIATCAADLFMLCDRLRSVRNPGGGASVTSLLTKGAKKPAAVVSLNFGSRSMYVADGVKPSLLALLCLPVRELHDRFLLHVDEDETSGGAMMLRRAPLALAPTRARASVLDWLDTNTVDVCWLHARDCWMVVRHANRRTVGLLFVDAVSLSDIADSVEALTSLFFNSSVPFSDVS